MAKNIDQEIRACIDSFAVELSALVKQAAVESVQDALGGGRRGPGRPRKTPGAPRGPRAGRRGPGRPKGSGGKRVRRSSDQIEALASRILAHVRSNQGHRLEEISRSLKIPSQHLKRPVATLMAEKRLRTKGQKRGTQYFTGAGGGGRKKKA